MLIENLGISIRIPSVTKIPADFGSFPFSPLSEPLLMISTHALF
jgi:hypothetical protein